MTSPGIDVRDLSMVYRVPVREAGVRAAIRSLWQRRTREVTALDGIGFQVGAGEAVGLIGPNGAGKTSLMKIMAGILRPTGGSVRVLGREPFDRHPDHLRRIALVRGSQPLGGAPELTVMDSLQYQGLVYDVAAGQLRRNLAELVDLLDLGGLLERQVRALSLGERMRAGLAMALVYRPAVLFLDEPTIGLDVSAAVQTRRFLRRYVAQTGATMILTSHYMADVAELCPRVVLINHGAQVYDGSLPELTAHVGRDRLVEVVLADDAEPPAGAHALGDGRYQLSVARDQVPDTVGRLLADTRVLDLGIKEAPLDVLMDEIYRRTGTRAR
ncbi:ABC transporter [Catellatospora methionotrophica]|uniref:ABC transporter n=1 Tax=Catellatospora methionotrophica TaxID=121620 RepID=A0A8J3LAC2_9ACTN|nr:ATP-binding cassette domain-containing protein [Catellatospora methionotrophica]GIG14548.1 ABC transporter [Catellatospora methionotrophica]